MGSQSIEDLLKTIGLTDKEMEIYFYLSKHGIQKVSEISNALNINKGLIYRILKNLELKGVVEVTLEQPTRYIPVDFEKLIGRYIESIQQEATLIENAKEGLLSDWKEIGKTEFDPSIEKFSVIEGEKKVFHKISQMIRETKQELISIATVDGLLRAEKFGVLDSILNHPFKSKLKIRYITNINEDNIDSIKYLLEKLNSVLKLKGKHPDLQSTKFPRLVIRDNEEILLFIQDKSTSDTVLNTNCKSIVRSFSELSEDIWSKSSDIEKIIQEVEKGKPPEIMEIIKDPNIAQKFFADVLKNSKKEIFIVTSSKGLIGVAKKINLLRKWNKKGISIKIMAPITTQNLKAMQQLLEFSDIRHIPIGYTEMTIIDDEHLFQFNKFATKSYQNEKITFEDVLYTNNSNYIKSNKNILLKLWKQMHTPNYNLQSVSILSDGTKGTHLPLWKMDAYGKKVIEFKPGEITENDILKKIENFKKNQPKHDMNPKWEDTLYFFGTRAFGLIQSPDFLNFPNFIVGAVQNTKPSSFGEENHLLFFIPSKEGSNFQLIAVVTDNPKSIEYTKRLYKGMPGQNNIILVKKKQLQIISKKNTLFVGWTIDIPIIPSKFVLPPGCILFEAYGKVTSRVFNLDNPCERIQEVWSNHLDAFLTYFHDKSQYVASGTEAFIDRNNMQISYPPPTVNQK